jgi:thiol-disulfide isomerase/thioredoxin
VTARSSASQSLIAATINRPGKKTTGKAGKSEPRVAKPRRQAHFGIVKIKRLLPLILAIISVTATGRANFFDEIKGDLAGPAVEGSPKYTALYFSAHWCPPCRMFTPKLVEWYNEFKPKHPDFELVFVSGDRNETAMEEYIKGDNMPWPFVKFDKAEGEVFGKYSSDGIPYLVLIDNEGKAVTAKAGNEWQAPDDVLAEIEKIVGGDD